MSRLSLKKEFANFQAIDLCVDLCVVEYWRLMKRIKLWIHCVGLCVVSILSLQLCTSLLSAITWKCVAVISVNTYELRQFLPMEPLHSVISCTSLSECQIHYHWWVYFKLLLHANYWNLPDWSRMHDGFASFVLIRSDDFRGHVRNYK